MSGSGIDPDVSRWVLDFLVCEGISLRVLIPLALALPLPLDPKLKKLILREIDELGPPRTASLEKALSGDPHALRVYLSSYLHSVAQTLTTYHKDADKRNSLSRRKHAAQKRSRGAKITNVNDAGAGPSCNSHLLDSPQVERLQEALESSRLELHAVVKDPLPEALRLAESVLNEHIEPHGVQIRGVDNALDVQFGQGNAGCSGQTNAPKSLMERKETARTFEWNDSIDSSPAELSESSSTSRPHLPTPRGRRVSPLNIYKEQKLKKKRKNKRWSIAEEDALRAGVEMCGKGYWKLILNNYHDIFEERTEVDLKDKWRNMTRYN